MAYEWGSFDLTYKPSEDDPPITFRTRYVRALKRQADGGGKLTGVIWAAE